MHNNAADVTDVVREDIVIVGAVGSIDALIFKNFMLQAGRSFQKFENNSSDFNQFCFFHPWPYFFN